MKLRSQPLAMVHPVAGHRKFTVWGLWARGGSEVAEAAQCAEPLQGWGLAVGQRPDASGYASCLTHADRLNVLVLGQSGESPPSNAQSRLFWFLWLGGR